MGEQQLKTKSVYQKSNVFQASEVLRDKKCKNGSISTLMVLSTCSQKVSRTNIWSKDTFLLRSVYEKEAVRTWCPGWTAKIWSPAPQRRGILNDLSGKRMEDWKAEAAVLNDFQVKRKETKVSLFLVLPLTAKYIWIGRSVEPCWLERRRAGRWGEDRGGPEGHLAPSSCSAQWRQVVRPLIYKASYNKGWSKCYEIRMVF